MIEKESLILIFPTISTENVMASEDDGYVEFVVRLSAPSADIVTVGYGTGSGSASSCSLSS